MNAGRKKHIKNEDKMKGRGKERNRKERNKSGKRDVCCDKCKLTASLITANPAGPHSSST